MPEPLQSTPPPQIIRNASWLRKHLRLDRGAVRLLTRTGLDWTHKYRRYPAFGMGFSETQP